MSSTKDATLPLGAVRTADGEVVVPASRRADGSTRKPIRIRQGYVPQDEVPKYKTVAQRRREQEAKQAAGAKSGGDEAVGELPMDKLSLEQKEKAERSGTAPRKDQERLKQSEKDAKAEAGGNNGDHQQQLKQQLTKINKQLKEITKLEGTDDASLSTQQKQKLSRRTALQQQRSEIIAELNGATVTRSSGSAAGPRPKVAISL